ncbi:MAG: two-component regulator propeller domain-containing protein [Bacteroidia bacterium]
MIRNLLLLIFVFIVLPVVSFSQKQYTFTNYTQEQGLASGTIRCMFKDTSGFLWLTSETGLSRFDGYGFKVFRHNPDDSTSIGNTWSGMSLVNGDVFFMSGSGNRFYNPGKLSFTKPLLFKDNIDIVSSYKFLDDSDGFWILNKACLIRISNHHKVDSANARFYRWTQQKYEKLFPVISTAADGVSRIIITTPKIVYLFDVNKKQFVKTNVIYGGEQPSVFSYFYSETLKSFFAISQNCLYRFNESSNTFSPYLKLTELTKINDISGGSAVTIGKFIVVLTHTGILYKLNIYNGDEKVFHLNKKIPKDEVRDNFTEQGYLDERGKLWIPARGMGLFRFDVLTDEWEQFINEPGNSNCLPSNSLDDALPDKNGVIWVACTGHGLVKMEELKPVLKSASPVANNSRIISEGENKNIRTFLEKENGYWIGTLKGLYQYDITKNNFTEITELTKQIGSDDGRIGTLAHDRSGNTWIGTWNGQLTIWNRENNKSIVWKMPDAVFITSHGMFRSLYCDSKNTMWISTYGAGTYTVKVNDLNFESSALLQLNPVLHDEKDSSSLSSDCLYTFVEDADGNIWAGANNGLNRYNAVTKKWSRFYNIQGNAYSIHGNDVRSLAFDKKGNLWIGTNGGGLNRYNKAENNFSHFTMENGLPDNAIYSMVCDNNGMLWLGTNYGLCRFNPGNYSCLNFTQKDGIQNYEYNTGAALKLKDGTLLIGGVDGYNIIDPDKIANRKSLPPAVVISSFKIFDHEVPLGNNYLELNYMQNSLNIEFAALSYYRNQDNRYAYKMDGIDKEWIYCNNRRFVSYSNLQPGNYTFRVKASNSDGVWNKTGTQLAITITPPWWQTTWAKILFGFIGVSCIIGYYRYRTQAFRARQKELKIQVEQRTEQLRMEKERAELLVTEKEMLMKEIHHRVKNNLEVISSLLELQTQRIPDEKAKAAIIESQSRVQSIALIHHKLYRNEDNTYVELKNFINDLFRQVEGVFKKQGTEVEFKMTADDLLVNTDTAVPLGLILNELLTNTFKYATFENKKNKIEIVLKNESDKNFKLIYRDNGNGMPIDFNIQKSTSLGMKVIQLLTKQLGGKLNFYNDNGSVFEIPFIIAKN